MPACCRQWRRVAAAGGSGRQPPASSRRRSPGVSEKVSGQRYRQPGQCLVEGQGDAGTAHAAVSRSRGQGQ